MKNTPPTLAMILAFAFHAPATPLHEAALLEAGAGIEAEAAGSAPIPYRKEYDYFVPKADFNAKDNKALKGTGAYWWLNDLRF